MDKLTESPSSESDNEATNRLKAEKWAYFANLVHEVRYEPSEEAAEMLRHNASIRARSAARVALSARMPVVARRRS